MTGQLPAPTEARMDTVVAEHIDNPDSDTRASLDATFARRTVVDIRTHGAVDGAPNNTAAIQAAVAAAGVDGIVLYPKGLWITDPVAGLNGQEHQIYGTVRLRGQSLATIPVVGTANGVIYFYGTSGNRLSNCGVRFFGGKVDGNRRGMSDIGSAPNNAFDMEGINFKYVDYWYVAGQGEVFDCIESGIDADLSKHGHTDPGIVSRDNYGWGFHMSNGAADNVVDGVAINNGFGNSRGGVDQYAGSSPQANRNIYRVKAYNNYRNFRIEGAEAILDGAVSVGGSQPDIITANIDAPRAGLSPARVPATPPVINEPIGGSTVDTEARAALNSVLDLLAEVGMRSAPVLVASDTFGRADGPLGTSDTGQVWTEWGSLFSILGGQARVNAITAIGHTYLPGLPMGNARITCTQIISSGSTRSGIAFRSTGPDCLVLEFAKTAAGADQVALRKRVGSTSTDLDVATSFGLVGGTSYEVRIDAVGDHIKAWVDNVLVVTHTLSPSDSAFFANQNRAGFYANASASGEDGGTRWSNFKHYTLPAA